MDCGPSTTAWALRLEEKSLISFWAISRYDIRNTTVPADGVRTDILQVVSDFPAVSFAPELIQAYPEAKVILTNRDVDDWYE